jgi:hypothetical protein
MVELKESPFLGLSKGRASLSATKKMRTNVMKPPTLRRNDTGARFQEAVELFQQEAHPELKQGLSIPPQSFVRQQVDLLIAQPHECRYVSLARR